MHRRKLDLSVTWYINKAKSDQLLICKEVSAVAERAMEEMKLFDVGMEELP
jgi:hypothetical protein